jgi:pancreatic triacylglycerol lipase
MMVEPIGKSVSQFIDWLHPKRLHVVGFDLGAHIAGIAGKYTTKERIDRITGLDPNRSGFNIKTTANRLATGDADYVDVFHSNGGKIGIMEHLVDMDYYISKAFSSILN